MTRLATTGSGESSAGRPGRAAVAGLATVLAVTLLLLAAAGIRAAPASGQAADDAATSGLGLEVVQGYGGEVAPTTWQPVAVFLEPGRPVRADLTVRADGPGPGQTVKSRSVEVAAGARTVHRFLVNARRISVVLDESGRDPVTVESEPGPPDRGFLAGVLGATPRGLPALRAEETRTEGTWVPVDPAWLERSMVALEPLGTLVAERGELAELSPAAAANLAAGVTAGTDLVVVADAEGPLELEALGLPASPATSATAASVPADDGGGPSTVRALEPAAHAWTLTVGDLRGDAGGAGGTGAPDDADEAPDDADEAGAADDAQTGDADDAVLAAATDVGRGRVAVVGVGPGETGVGEARQLWEELVGPGSRGRPRPDRLAQSSRDLAGLFADGDGGQLPSLPWFPVFLAAYVAVVGPVNWLVLRRLGRRELAWVTVPVVTVVFTAAAFFAAVSEQPPGGSAGRVAYWLDSVGGEVVAVGVRSPTPADRVVAFPGEGWVVAPSTAGGGQVRVERTSDSETRVRLSLDALEPGGALAWRAHDAEPPLRVKAVAGRDGTEVTVTNATGSAVEDVDVRVATARGRVGDLPAGASETVVLSGPRLPARGPGGPSGPPRPGHPWSGEGLEQLITPSPLDGSPGIAWAIGSAEGEAAGVSVDGDAADDAGTLLAVGASVRPPDDGPVAPMAVRRSFHGDPTLDVIAPSAVELSDELVLRYRLPASGDLERLYGDLERSDLDRPQHADLTVWGRRERRWLPHAEALAGGGEPARFVSPLGQVHVRATGDFVPFEFSARTVSGLDVAEEQQ